MQHKTAIATALAVAIIVAGAVVVWFKPGTDVLPEPEATPEVTPEIETQPTQTVTVIGASVEGREIEAYTFGSGDTKLLFVGGIHGGYEWNSVVLAYDFIDYFTANPALVPETMTVSIIPNLNPDAVFDVTGIEGRFAATDVVATETELAAARFNAREVDLNRNFDCKWAPESSWRGQTVSAGTGAFSEPEAVALRDYVATFAPDAAVFWHSQADTVYASECEAGVLPETLAIMDTYAAAADYNTQASFDAYTITGDAEGWLASIGIPAITVELSTHKSTDWQRNVRGVTALLNHYSINLAR